MAGGSDVAAPKSHGKKGKKRRKGRRLGTRIDFTPLVDVAFLLLTFFMFTTSMSRPQTMEINLPPDKSVHVEVGESNLLTLRISDKGDIFWNIGLEAPKRIAATDLRSFLREKVQSNPKLVVVLKIERSGKYAQMVGFIDEFAQSHIERFSLAPLVEQDKVLMAKAQ
jgi:biopolymer transport protein ExbD